MAKKKKNQHIMYHRNWHAPSYSEQARDCVWARIQTWENFREDWYKKFEDVLISACHSYRCNEVKYKMIKGLRRYGKRKRLI